MATAGLAFPGAGSSAYPTPYEPLGGADNPTTRYLYEIQNMFAGQGQQAYQKGQAGYQAGLEALGPTMQYLTQLTKGDQGDISQAIQPEANRIRDSFAAVRNMISAQPRGGGKAGAMAEAPYQEQRQIGDLAAQARQGAAGELGNVAKTLAGLGLEETGVGQKSLADALNAVLTRRGQNVQERAATMQMVGELGKAAGGVAAAFAP